MYTSFLSKKKHYILYLPSSYNKNVNGKTFIQAANIRQTPDQKQPSHIRSAKAEEKVSNNEPIDRHWRQISDWEDCSKDAKLQSANIAPTLFPEDSHQVQVRKLRQQARTSNKGEVILRKRISPEVGTENTDWVYCQLWWRIRRFVLWTDSWTLHSQNF